MSSDSGADFGLGVARCSVEDLHRNVRMRQHHETSHQIGLASLDDVHDMLDRASCVDGREYGLSIAVIDRGGRWDGGRSQSGETRFGTDVLAMVAQQFLRQYRRESRVDVITTCEHESHPPRPGRSQFG